MKTRTDLGPGQSKSKAPPTTSWAQRQSVLNAEMLIHVTCIEILVPKSGRIVCCPYNLE